MQKLTTGEIPDVARDILRATPGGMRWADLCRAVQNKAPATPANTISATLVWWAANRGEVVKPSRGLWVLKSNLEAVESLPANVQAEADTSKPKEISLYTPFADWLVTEADEATVARPLGGSSLKSKWGTPDVIGTSKPKANDPLKFPIEIIAAELKSDGNASIVAFGQACAYRLFAHRSCVVMPAALSAYDRDRLLTLCGLYGIGLVLWTQEPDGVRFRFEVRPRSHQPDTYYANEFAKRIRDQDPDAFNEMF